MNSIHFTLALICLTCYVSAAVTSQSYTTKEDISASRTLFVSQFQFEGDAPKGTLYAEVGDKSMVVGKSTDGKSFQVSWSDEHKAAGAGTYQVKIYDEESYSNIRKARRDGENSNVQPVATLEINHQGVWKGPWFSSETVASIVALTLIYCAYTRKSEILS